VKRTRTIRLTVLALVLVLAIAVAAVSAIVFAGRDDAPEFRGSRPPGDIALPDFRLRDHTGQAVSRERVRGKVVLTTFLETKCREACPIIASQVARALELLAPDERKDVVALAISVHPEDDTAASARAFLRKHGAEEELRYLIGSEKELRPVWERFDVLSALDSGDADTHSASVHVYDRTGTWVSTLHPGVDLTPENLAHDAGLALAGSDER
jgi:protein SCO1/2